MVGKKVGYSVVIRARGDSSPSQESGTTRRFIGRSSTAAMTLFPQLMPNSGTKAAEMMRLVASSANTPCRARSNASWEAAVMAES